MDCVNFEAATHNPELIRALMREARRERAEAMHRLLIEPLKRLLGRHAARTHLGYPRKAGGTAA